MCGSDFWVVLAGARGEKKWKSGIAIHERHFAHQPSTPALYAQSVFHFFTFYTHSRSINKSR